MYLGEEFISPLSGYWGRSRGRKDGWSFTTGDLATKSEKLVEQHRDSVAILMGALEAFFQNM